ncbi:MAG: ParB N-terminal domain-containing protein [Nitrospira sp.]|nr:ParB N-terminal domain-containing protein [Nitrospira sp.]MCP9441544.1 ParB N-terminal domain-containing protein [Nitrospira sp.]
MLQDDGGEVLAVYREPYGGHWLVLAGLPLELVEPTPYQRNVSATHAKKLETVISKMGRFLDPIIVVRMSKADHPVRYWTPNGNHRLTAMRELGAKSIVAIVVPEPTAAYQILAMNTEKAHNLRERALEVGRLYRELARLDSATEKSYALEFEEAALITLGFCYEERPRFTGGVYHPMLKKVDAFLAQSLRETIDVRRQRAQTLLELDDLIIQRVEALVARGLTSPYLKNFVVARVNPIRFRSKTVAPLSFDEAMERMAKAVHKFNPDTIKSDDLAKAGGPPPEAE